MSSKPIILGINTVYHETSACILRGAEVLAFAYMLTGKLPRIVRNNSINIE